MPKVSVIVPVYNVEKYLDSCLTSLVNQDFQDYEIIIIDDASTDSSLTICQKYAKLYPQITLINSSENQGVSVARNKGIRYSSGQYLSFVDPDDYVASDFLSMLYKAAMASSADLVVCNFYRFYDQGRSIKVASKNFNSFLLSPKDFLGTVFSLNTSHHPNIQVRGFVWNKFIRRDIIGKDLFEPSNGAEDEIFLMKIFSRLEKIEYIGKPLYFYNQRSSSLSKSPCYILGFLKTRFSLLNMEIYSSDKEIISTVLYQTALITNFRLLKEKKTTISEWNEFRKISMKPLNYERARLGITGVTLNMLKMLFVLMTCPNLKTSFVISKCLYPLIVLAQYIRKKYLNFFRSA